MLSSRVLSCFRLSCTLGLVTLLGACAPSAPSAPPTTDAGHHATITLHDAWVRQPPPGATVAAAYLQLTNPGPHADRLVAVETSVAERVEIHDMQMVSGMMQMRPLEHGLALPAGESVHLAPGGLHLMLMAPKVEWGVGEEVEMSLKFEHAPAQTVMFQVRPLLEADTTSPHQHGHNHH